MFNDDLSQAPHDQDLPEGSTFSQDWTSVFNGFGRNEVTLRNNVWCLHMTPKSEVGQTHSAMIIGPHVDGDIDLTWNVETARQLSQGTPNPWEIAWLGWHYSDNDHFYYFIAKPNGWELGRRDPAGKGGQVFLQTGPDTFDIGVRRTFRVVQQGSQISVSVDGTEYANFNDAGGYTSGNIAAYTEDAEVFFDSVLILP